MESQILRCRAVCAKIGVSRSTLFRLCKAGQFPAQLRLTERLVGWRKEDVDEWIAARRPVSVDIEDAP